MIIGAICPAARAGIILPDLAPGTEYRLVFVTQGGMAATSSAISDYNIFVSGQADENSALSALGAT
jgi:hypothetical protein